MSSHDFEEMVEVLKDVVKVNRAVTRPYLEKKTGLKVVSKGRDFGEIVTEADIGISDALLNGHGVKGITGFRQRYLGSFSEEQDYPLERQSALILLQLDPMDGTGDFKKTYQTENVMPPTTLVSKLVRNNVQNSFRPVAGIIFDIVNEVALVSDGSEIGLFAVSTDGIPHSITFRRLEESITWSAMWHDGDTIFINQRTAYPQNNFDREFINFLQTYWPVHRIVVKQVPVGGAGIIALQLFRNVIQPVKFSDIPSFANLRTINICFNAQPDWKTWDTNPTDVIADALGLPPRTTIYGDPITPNAAAPSLKEMHHTNGYVLSTDVRLQAMLCERARAFQEKYPNKPLTEKNY